MIRDAEPWMQDGLCPQFPDINFVPDPFLGEDALPAKNVCMHCPVLEKCVRYGARHSALGVWGGEDEIDRLMAPRVDATCGCDSSSAVVPTMLGNVCFGCGSVTA